AQPIMWLTLSSDSMSMMELTDYMERYVVDRFATIPGVSQIRIFGAGGPSMRIWLDRHALAARNLTVVDVENALRAENLELPAGRVESEALTFQVRLARNYQTAEDFRRLVIFEGEDGHLVRLGEVADVEVGPRETKRLFRTNGATTTGFGIVKQSTANTVEVLDAVKAEVVRVNADLPEGMELITSGDDSIYIRAAIASVYETIVITTVLVGFVIYVFLGKLRAALIPLVTIPVCLISSFTALAFFGFSINLVTLLALALCIGLVVDDSIVVLENVHRRIEEGEAPLLASFNGTRQVSFAIISSTAVLVSVFAPVAFLKDNIGRIFAELAVTMAAALVFSLILALSLAPMMCSKLLGPATREGRLMHALDAGFARLSAAYRSSLGFVLKAPWVALVVGALIGVGAYFLVESVPREYAPEEDQGQFNAQLQAPEGASFEQMVEAGLKAEAYMAPYFENGLIQRGVVAVPGWGSAAGIVNVALRPWDGRPTTPDELLWELNRGWSEIPEVRIIAFPRRSGGGGGGGGQPVQIVLGGPTYEELARWRDIIIEHASRNPGLIRIDSNLKETQPQVLVRVDADRAASLGVSQRAIGQTLQTMMAERAVTTYVVDGEEYD
ncbi:MAG: efflux RND transporter permease subunit, partial [Gammaproteobacteria bacterium]